MLGGWYCRSLANEQEQQNEVEPQVDVNDSSVSDDSREQEKAEQAPPGNNIDYRTQYRYLKRKFKYLIYENEFFQDALRSNQRRLLKVSRDRAFLLDRLLQYEKPENTSSESDGTESSDDETAKEAKKRKLADNANNAANATNGTGTTRGRKKKVQPMVATSTVEKQISEVSPLERPTVTQQQHPQQQQQQHFELRQEEPQQLGHMTAAEVERHLENKQPAMGLLPEHASATVPTEMFSNEPSLDSESNDHFMGSSPTHVAAEECVPMEYSN